MCVTVTAVQEGHNIVIAYPGQEVELICSLGWISGSTEWIINNMGPYGVSSLYNGLIDGYSASTHTNSIIILNITMNDSRNAGTEYQCGIFSGSFSLWDDLITLYVAGEFQ